jgi:hypothetical protein
LYFFEVLTGFVNFPGKILYDKPPLFLEKERKDLIFNLLKRVFCRRIISCKTDNYMSPIGISRHAS